MNNKKMTEGYKEDVSGKIDHVPSQKGQVNESAKKIRNLKSKAVSPRLEDGIDQVRMMEKLKCIDSTPVFDSDKKI